MNAAASNSLRQPSKAWTVRGRQPHLPELGNVLLVAHACLCCHAGTGMSISCYSSYVGNGVSIKTAVKTDKSGVIVHHHISAAVS